MTQTEAIREAFEKLGADAALADVRKYLEGAKVELTSSFASIVSKERGKLKVRESNRTEADMLELMRLVRDILAQLGETKTRQAIADFEELHALAGSWELIRQVLDIMTGPPSNADQKK